MMTKPMRDAERVISELSDAERFSIISDYEQFEQYGYIGDCKLRELATEIIRTLHLSGGSHLTMWMNILAVECYRYFSGKWVQDNVDKVSSLI